MFQNYATTVEERDDHDFRLQFGQNFWNQFCAHFLHVQFFSKNLPNGFSIYVGKESYLLDRQPVIIFQCLFVFSLKDGVMHLDWMTGV